MTKRTGLLLTAAIVIQSLCAQAPKKAAPVTWIDAAMSYKAELQSKQKAIGYPIESEEVKKGEPKKISANVTNLDHIALVIKPGKDGKINDDAIWANAKVYTKEGVAVDIKDLKIDGYFSLTENLHRHPVVINRVPAKSSILQSPGSYVYVPLDKKYVRFESEIGIDDEGDNKTATVFRIQSESGRVQYKDLEKRFPQECYSFFPFSSYIGELWLTNGCTCGEKKALARIIGKFKVKDFYSNEVKKIEALPAAKQTAAYLSLFKEVFNVMKIEDELTWIKMKAINLAFNDMKNNKGFNVAANQEKLNQLTALVKGGFDGIYSKDAKAIENAKKAIALKKEILFANPLLDMDKIVVGHYKLGSKARFCNSSSLGTQSNNWSHQSSAPRTGFDAEITLLSNLRNGLKYNTIFKADNSSSVPFISMHWNADRMMFSKIDEKGRWQVYEIGVDGKNLKQLTKPDESDIEYYDGTYLPSGKIIAASNVGYQGVPCVNGGDQVGNLCLIDPNTQKMRRLTFDQESNYNPTVMNNGRIMFTRWEYTDLTHYYSRIIMHMNPDGTEQKALYGSGSYFPNTTFDCQPLPGNSTRFVGIITGHHGTVRSGRLIIFDPAKSRKDEKGMLQEIPYRDRKIEPIIKDQMVDGVWPQFIKPMPLNEKYFLVTAKLDNEGLWGLYLVDIYDNMTQIAEVEGEGFINANPVMSKPVPPMIPDKIKEDSKEASVFIQDIYEGEGLKNVPRGTVKKVRIFAYEYAYNRSPSNHDAQGIQSGWDIKRLLGEAPVEADGSVGFKIPANTPISIQPLDEEGRALQWMRSWTTGMPGEVISCVGCHEDQNQIPKPKSTLASKKTPMMIEKPVGGVRSFTYELEVQPVLDRACVACHNGTKGNIDYTPGKIDPFSKYSKSYLNLHPYVFRQGPEAEMEVLNPYEYHANVSHLIQMLKRGHHGVKLTDKEWKTLYTWIDLNAPYHGSFKAEQFKGFDQIKRRIELTEKYGRAGVDWQSEIKAYADYLKTQPKPEPYMPAQVVTKAQKEVKVKGWPFAADAVKTMLAKETQTKKVVDLGNGIKMTFVRVPAGSFVMGKAGNSDYSPAMPMKVEKSFWMSEIEVSNEQMRALIPTHNSRFIQQQWKDHTTPGYVANNPEQPAIRMTWNEAMEYCKKLSAKTGLKANLPTETQWEWACRAGSNSDFWYGNFNTSFAQFENMADKQLNKLAVSGVNPQPMPETWEWYKYYTFHPKDNTVDDGSFLTVKGAGYKPNAFGLYDMQGNVSEWTRSDYVPYPLNPKKPVSATEKVVRGGSWEDAPKTSTAYFRKSYYPWQSVHNVGFRVILED